MNLIVLLLVGLLVGIIAQAFMGGGLGWVLSILLGVGGVFLGGWLFGLLGIGGGLIFQIIAGVIGACLILFAVRRLKGKKRR